MAQTAARKMQRLVVGKQALATQAGEQPLWTFDKGGAKVSGAKLLVR